MNLIPKIFRKRKPKFKRGDVVRATIAGTSNVHTCIILKDVIVGNHVDCLPVCNFTGSIIPEGQYSIDVSEIQFPESWFGKVKNQTWLRCNEIDCIYNFDIQGEKVGNIIDLYPQLWSRVCEAVHSCPVSEKLQQACDCDYKIIEKEIDLGKRAKSKCGCKT